VNGTYTYSGLHELKNSYSRGGLEILWSSGAWYIIDNDTQSTYYSSTDDVLTPDLVTTWQVEIDGTAPPPTVSSGPC